MTTGRRKTQAPLHLSTRTLVIAALAVSAIYGTGFLRTRAAAARLTQSEGRRRPTEADRREAQPVLDIARFATDAGSGPVLDPPRIGATPPPTIGAPPTRTDARTASPDAASPATNPASTGAPASAPATPGHASAPEPETVFIPGAPASTPTSTGEGTAAAAPTSTPADVAAAPAPPKPKEPRVYRDGTFTGWGYCRHGEIQARVVIEHGRITDAVITQCLTRYSCDWIEKLPGQVVSRQSEEVDYVAGASESADAFYYAIVEALKQAK